MAVKADEKPHPLVFELERAAEDMVMGTGFEYEEAAEVGVPTDS